MRHGERWLDEYPTEGDLAILVELAKMRIPF
jgi:hypothetical protein